MVKNSREIYDVLTSGLVQGPRQKSKATYELEEIVNALLDPKNKIKCRYNSAGELEIDINNYSYNLTQILKHTPDFEHLSFENESLNHYASFLRKDAKEKPELAGDNNFPEERDYKQLDPKGLHQHLHYAEKLSITLYSGPFYKPINDFLRSHGQQESLKAMRPDKLTSFVKELVLGVCIASHGLAKPQEKVDNNIGAGKDFVFNHLTRTEVHNDEIAAQRKAALLHQQPLTAKGFTSTSVDTVVVDDNADTKLTVSQLDNAMGRNIKELAHNSAEKEVLFVPNTQFLYHNESLPGRLEKEEHYRHHYQAIPVRAVTEKENLPSHYSRRDYSGDKVIAEQLTILRDQLLIQNEKKKGFFSKSFFNTICRKGKVECVDSVITAIQSILTDYNKNKKISPENLDHLKSVIETAMKKNDLIVANASFPQLSNTTNKMLVVVKEMVTYLAMKASVAVEVNNNQKLKS